MRTKLYLPGFSQSDSRLIESFIKAESHMLLCSPAGRKCGLFLSANTGTIGASEMLLRKLLMLKIFARNGSNFVARNFLLIINTPPYRRN
jgi:hypothetical protein